MRGSKMKAEQATRLSLCGRDALVRYTWPGKDESYACEEHARGIAAVAHHIGLHLQMILLRDGHGLKCQSQTEGRMTVDGVNPEGETRSPVMSAAYHAGREAQREGKSYDDCPYPNGLDRVDFFTGYLDSQFGVSVATRVEKELEDIEAGFAK